MSTPPFRPQPVPSGSPDYRRAKADPQKAAAIVGLVVLGLATGPAAFMGNFLGIITYSCGTRGHCVRALADASSWIAILGPVLVFVAALVAIIVLYVRKSRAAVAVPWVGLGLDVVCFLTGYTLALAAMGS